ncbi:TIGR03086 family metal-binding protein [Kineococcus terrestris]|uniref:TIGR03086 family metal-binding protein n=1 Tax=Kineococcus terrestris TaxID=2044856 RepID=UPI0034DB0498
MDTTRDPHDPAPHDLAPAAGALAAVVAAVREEHLRAPTPCAPYAVGDLLDHVDAMAAGMLSTARKRPVPPELLRDSDAALLRPGWRERVPAALRDLAVAWADPAAWRGETTAGAVPLPAAAAGMFVLDELVVHGWDLARAAGLPLRTADADVAALLEFLRDVPRAPGLFGPPVAVPQDAPALDRLVGLTGRDPAWAPPR